MKENGFLHRFPLVDISSIRTKTSKKIQIATVNMGIRNVQFRF